MRYPLAGRIWCERRPPGLARTEADLSAHAGISGDYGALHMDAQRAAQGQFGGRVAHGSLLISIAMGLGSMDVPQPNLVALVGTNWRFLKPVKPGMTVHAVWRLGRKREVTNPRWGLAVWQIELLDQDEERVLEGEVTVLVNRRQAAAGAPARSRRRRRGKAVALPALPTAEANLPEPAPADTPAPARRRRRSSRAAPAEKPAPEPAVSAEAPASSTSSRRRRRRRGGGGGGNGGGQTSTPADASETAPPEPPRSQWAAPDTPVLAPQPAAPENNNPVSRVLGRLRRSRRAAPAPGGTRPPSE